MIRYIERNADQSFTVARDDGSSRFTGSLRALLDGIALNRLSTAAAAARAAMRVLRRKRLVPLYLDAETLLLPLSGPRSARLLLVNRLAIAGEPDDRPSAVVAFRGGGRLVVASGALLKARMRMADVLLDHLERTGNR